MGSPVGPRGLRPRPTIRDGTPFDRAFHLIPEAGGEADDAGSAGIDATRSSARQQRGPTFGDALCGATFVSPCRQFPRRHLNFE